MTPPLTSAEFAREARRTAQAQGVVTTPAPPPPTRERQRTPAPAKEEESAKFVRPAAPPPQTVKVNLPGDGQPDTIRDYFNRTYGTTRTNSTAERAKRLCAKLAADTRTEAYSPVGDWRGAWDTTFKIGEEAHG